MIPKPFALDELLAAVTSMVRFTAEVTRTGEPLAGATAAGKRVVLPEIAVVRIVNGQIVEHWNEMDNPSLLRQLGAFPAPGQGSSS